MIRNKKYRFFISFAIAISVLLFAFCVAVNRNVVFEADRGNIFHCDDSNISIKADEKYDAIVVLGAGLQADGSPSHMLEDRLRAAVALWRAGASDVLILSGDRSGEHYDEVGAMEKYCLEAGVPAKAIRCDYSGFSTYETVINAITGQGVKRIVIVTQEYHLYRAMYLARRMGADADGMAADYRAYRGQMLRDIREYMARIKDFLYVNTSILGEV